MDVQQLFVATCFFVACACVCWIAVHIFAEISDNLA